MVVVATGLCPSQCFYCPLSFKKGGKDCVYADEWELQNEHDTEKLIHEAEYINATGAGITGGDPLLVWQRVKHYISLLKNMFGDTFHIHLYTSGLKHVDHIPDLISAGLDEIRFHPMPLFWDNMDNSPLSHAVKTLTELDVDVALEIPVIPGMEQQMISLIRWADEVRVNWVNLNELEFSERNCDALSEKGFSVKDEISAAVKGSQEAAVYVLNKVATEDLDVGVHYCSVSFKDGVQLSNRIKRRAQNVAKSYEIISDEGTLIKGVIYSATTSAKELYAVLRRQYEIPEKFLFLDKEKNRVEIGLWILETIAPALKKQAYECYMVEEYPTADRLEVERAPLPL